MADIDKKLTRQALAELGYENSWVVDDAEPPASGRTFAESEPLPPLPPLGEEKLFSDAPTSTPVSYSRAPEPAPEPTRELPPEEQYSEPPPPAPSSPEPTMSEPPPPAPPTERAAPAPSRPAPRREAAPAPSAPSPTPAPAAGGESPRIEDKAWNPGASTRELRGDVEVAKQRGLDIAGEQQEAVAGKGERDRQIEEARSTTGADGVARQRDVADRQHDRSEDVRARMETELADLKKEIANPPSDTMGMVFSIISAISAANGKAEVGKALQGLGNAMNHKMNKWKAGIEAGERDIEGMGKIATYDRLAASDDSQAEALIAKAAAAEFDLAFDALERDAKTEKERQAIAMARNDMRSKMAQGELNTRAKAAAAQRLREINARLANAPSEEERERIANQYGDDGRDLYQDMLKTKKSQGDVTQGIVGNEKLAAETQLTLAKWQSEKSEAAAAGKPAPGLVPGRVSTVDLPNQAAAKIVDGNMAQAKVKYSIERLLHLAEEVKAGRIDKTDATVGREIADLRNALVSQRTNLAGAGAPTGKEYDDTLATIADPQEFFRRGDARTVLLRTLQNTEGSWDRALRAAGQIPAGEAQGGQSRPAGGGEVTVIDQNGKSLKMSPTAAKAFTMQVKGSRLADEEPTE